MNKNLMTLAAGRSVLTIAFCCAMMILTSCTNDDNPVIPKTGRAVITVNPSALYEELNVAKLMSSLIESGVMTVRDSVLIYDQSGCLLTKLGVETNSLQPVTIETGDLPNGTYTLVAWQSAHASYGQAYYLSGEEQLSTVSIKTTSSNLGYMWAVGYASATVTVEGGSLEASVSPKSLGSIIEVWVDNLTVDKGYQRVRLIGSNAQYVNGCRLDPSLGEEDRWIMEREHGWDEYVGFVPSTTNYDRYFTLSHGNVTFYLYGEKEDGSRALIYNGDHHLGTGDFAFFYLDMNRLNWQPSFFGNIKDFVAWKTDRDAGILVNNPCLKWGSNVDEVRQYVKTGYQWWLPINEYPAAVRVGFWGVRYYLAGMFYEEYDFETEDGRNLQRVCDVCYDPALTLDMVNASLVRQGYVYKGKITFPGYPPYDVFFSADGTIEVQTVPDTNKLTILYQPTDPADLPYITPAE